MRRQDRRQSLQAPKVESWGILLVINRYIRYTQAVP